MWHNFLALPPGSQVMAWIVSAGVALFVAIKRKAIKKAGEVASARFWRWAYKKAALGRTQGTNERTYKGILEEYWYTSTPRDMHFFRVTHDGEATTVEVLDTNLLYQIKRGKLVEIDTEVLPGCTYEIIKRVRTVTR